MNKKLLLAGAVCAMLPDADTLAMWMGVPYESVFGHRGFTHSIFFAAMVAIVGILFSKQTESKAATALYLFLATLSHPLLDALTSGGLGVAFFSPFSNHRYFFPWRPIRVSHIGVGQFIKHNGLAVLKNEFIWLWLPSLAVMTIVFILRRTNHRPSQA
jgi:inner membrane protein